MQSPSSQIFKARLHKAMSNLVASQLTLRSERGHGRDLKSRIISDGPVTMSRTVNQEGKGLYILLKHQS